MLVTSLAHHSLAHATDELRILLTSELEGRVQPRAACCGAPRLGGLARLMTVVRATEGDGQRPLLVDAGNAFFGGASLRSDGRIVGAAFDRLGYVVVNVSYRDFRLGKEATQRIARESRFSMLSANLFDKASGELLFDPYLIDEYDSRTVGILSVTFAPQSLRSLPRRRSQTRRLEGLCQGQPVLHQGIRGANESFFERLARL